MLVAPSTPAEPEALRRAALEALRGARPDAPELRRRYAESCVRRFAAPIPTLWPRRTRGRALRIVVLVGARAEPAIDGALATLAALPRESFQVAFATLGDAKSRSLRPAGASQPAPLIVALNSARAAEDAKRLAALAVKELAVVRLKEKRQVPRVNAVEVRLADVLRAGEQVFAHMQQALRPSGFGQVERLHQTGESPGRGSRGHEQIHFRRFRPLCQLVS